MAILYKPSSPPGTEPPPCKPSPPQCQGAPPPQLITMFLPSKTPILTNLLYLVIAAVCVGVTLVILTYALSEYYRLIASILTAAFWILNFAMVTIPLCARGMRWTLLIMRITTTAVGWTLIMLWFLTMAGCWMFLAMGIWLLYYRMVWPEDYWEIVEEGRKRRMVEESISKHYRGVSRRSRSGLGRY